MKRASKKPGIEENEKPKIEENGDHFGRVGWPLET